METIITRIKKIAELQGISLTTLEASIGASKGVLSRAYSNRTDIQSKWLVSLVKKYPQYSPQWLLSGKEPILQAEIKQLEDFKSVYLGSLTDKRRELRLDELHRIVILQEETIQAQRLAINALQSSVELMKKEIKK